MTICTCELCLHSDERKPRKMGKCHSYSGGIAWEPCENDAIPGDLLCEEHAAKQSDIVRSISREIATRMRRGEQL